MERLLSINGAQAFEAAFNDAVDQPHLLWNQDLRTQLSAQVGDLCSTFKDTLASSSLSLYEFAAPPKIAYNPIDKEICVGTMYLRLYNERKNNGYTCAFPEFWTAELVQAMTWSLSDADLAYLLDAQRTAIARHSNCPSFQMYQFFPELCRTLVSKPKSDVEINLVHLASDCLTGLLTVGPENAQKSFDQSSLVSVTEAFLNFVSLDLNNDLSASVLKDLLGLIDMYLVKVGDTAANQLSDLRPESSIVALNKQMLREITKLIDFKFAEKFPSITVQALTTLHSMANFANLRQCLLENGTILHMIYLTIFAPFSKENLDHPNSIVTVYAAHALSSLAGLHPKSPSGVAFNADLLKVFRGLLTPGLYRELSNPTNFIDISRGNTVNPILIWNSNHRQELLKYVTRELDAVRSLGNWAKWKSQPFEFTFKCLSQEIFIDDVFLYVYNQLHNEFKMPNDPAIFMEKLVGSIANSGSKIAAPEVKETEIEYEFHYSFTCAVALRNLIGKNPSLLETQMKNALIQAIQLLFDSYHLNVHVIQNALVVLKELVVMDSTANAIVTHFRHVVHRVLNMPREDFSKHPHLALCLEILVELCTRNSTVSTEFLESGFVLSVLNVFAHSLLFWPAHRMLASKLIGILAKNPLKGEAFLSLFCFFFAKTFQEYVLSAKDQPDRLIRFFDQDTDTPVVFWTENCRKDLVACVQMEMAPLIAHQMESLKLGTNSPPYSWDASSLPQRAFRPTMKSQICFFDIYVNAFNANPFFQVNSGEFFHKIMEGLTVHSELYIKAVELSDEAESKRQVANLVSLWDAVFNLLTNTPDLQKDFVKHLVFLFHFFDPCVHVAVQEVCLKLASLVATNPAVAENISKAKLLNKILPLLLSMHNDKKKIITLINFVMEIIRRSSVSILDIKACGGVLLLLDIASNPARDKSERKTAAQAINAMIQDTVHGKVMAEYVMRIFTKRFSEVFQARPEKFVQFIDDNHESLDDNRMWTDDQRDLIRKIISNEAAVVAVNMASHSGSEDLFDVTKIDEVWKTMAS